MTTTASAAQALKSASHRHDGIVNWLVLNPHRSLGECATEMGYTQAWISRIIHSDVFQALYQKRCQELGIVAVHTVKNRLNGIAAIGLERMQEKIESGQCSERFLGDSTKLALESLGYVGRSATGGGEQHLHLHAVDADLLRSVREKVLVRKAGTTEQKGGQVVEHSPSIS